MRDKVNVWWARQNAWKKILWAAVFLLPLWGPFALVKCAENPDARREYEARQSELRHQERTERLRARKEQRRKDVAAAARMRQEREARQYDREHIEPGDKVETHRRTAAFKRKDKAELYEYCIRQENYELAEYTYNEAEAAEEACRLYIGTAYDVAAADSDMVQVRDGGNLWWTAKRWMQEVED